MQTIVACCPRTAHGEQCPYAAGCGAHRGAERGLQMHVCTDTARTGPAPSWVHEQFSAGAAIQTQSQTSRARRLGTDGPFGGGRIPWSPVRERCAGRPEPRAKRRQAALPTRLETVRASMFSTAQDPGHGRRPSRVLIAGAGVAGLESLLALHALAGDRVDITLLAPETKFTNRPMSVDAPFKPQRVRGLKLAKVAAEFGATWRRGTLDRVDHERHVAVTHSGDEIAYDKLVLAMGARPEWDSHAQAQSFCDGHDAAANRLLLHQLREGRISKVAYVKPPGVSWPLPLYDLALMTAADCAAHGRSGVELTLVTPEEEPLALFGHTVSAAIGRLLERQGIAVHTSSYGVINRDGGLDVSPGGRSLAVDRIVTEPRLSGPIVRGFPFDHDRFIRTDAHGRVPGLDDVFAAGDATAFPDKHGGLAAEQADAVA